MACHQSSELLKYTIDGTCISYYKTSEEVAILETREFWVAAFILAGFAIAAAIAIRHSVLKQGRCKRSKSNLPAMLKLVEIHQHACELAKTASTVDNVTECIHLTQKHHLLTNDVVPRVGLTLFQCACISGDARLIEHFLKYGGANVFKNTPNNDTVFYLAVFGYLHSSKKDLEALRILLEYGCKVTATNSRGFTPLHVAAHYGDVKLTKFLLEQGADPKQDKEGIYPLDIAIAAGHGNLYELLKPP